MPKIAMLNQEGAKVGEIELSEAIFASEINESVLHLVVRSQLAAKRQGTQSAKTRGEVRGGGRKIYRQKGTGNARHHGNRAPQFTHGGMVFAVKPRDYRFKVPKKVRRLAMAGARFSLGIWFLLGLLGAAACFAWEFWSTRGREPQACFAAFLHNHWAGLAILLGIVVDYALR